MKTENRKARHNYEILDTYEAGIVLFGCEIKSIRSGNVNISDTYCVIDNGEVWVKNMYIKEYENKGYTKIDPYRDRKLLLTKNEIRKLSQKVKTKGLTVVPITLFINKNGYAKMNIALCKGKHEYDKKQQIKDRDIQREMDRNLM